MVLKRALRLRASKIFSRKPRRYLASFTATAAPPNNMKGLQSLGLCHNLTRHNSSGIFAVLEGWPLELGPAVMTMRGASRGKQRCHFMRDWRKAAGKCDDCPTKLKPRSTCRCRHQSWLCLGAQMEMTHILDGCCELVRLPWTLESCRRLFPSRA